MWNDLWLEHKGKITGVIFGIFLGIIYLIFGFWKMLVFGGIVWVGFYFGSRVDRRKSPVHISDIYYWIVNKWKMFK